MASTDDKTALKITLDDLAKVSVAAQSPAAAGAAPGTARQYGNIASRSDEPAVAEEGKSNIFLQGWFYLGVAGTLGALIGWAIGEPFFPDGQRQVGQHSFLALMLIPLVLIFLCVGLSIAESIVERSVGKALQRAGLSLPLGLGLSVVFMMAGGLVFTIGQEICFSLGVTTYKNPLFWLARGLAWMVFASAAGIAYGVVGRFLKKGQYGVLGAIIGGGIGGMLFDPISIVTHSGGPSRAIGFALIGLTTGVAIGLVESALKDRWLYVAAGPLAGKQFILYKPFTVVGSSQQCDIYLFKDPSVLARHGTIELRGAQTFLHADGQIYVSGQPAKNRALQSGDLIQIGKYAFHFRERHRK